MHGLWSPNGRKTITLATSHLPYFSMTSTFNLDSQSLLIFVYFVQVYFFDQFMFSLIPETSLVVHPQNIGGWISQTIMLEKPTTNCILLMRRKHEWMLPLVLASLLPWQEGAILDRRRPAKKKRWK